jgi:hypothetical protein
MLSATQTSREIMINLLIMSKVGAHCSESTCFDMVWGNEN